MGVTISFEDMSVENANRFLAFAASYAVEYQVMRNPSRDVIIHRRESLNNDVNSEEGVTSLEVREPQRSKSFEHLKVTPCVVEPIRCGSDTRLVNKSELTFGDDVTMLSKWKDPSGEDFSNVRLDLSAAGNTGMNLAKEQDFRIDIGEENNGREDDSDSDGGEEEQTGRWKKWKTVSSVKFEIRQ